MVTRARSTYMRRRAMMESRSSAGSSRQCASSRSQMRNRASTRPLMLHQALSCVWPSSTSSMSLVSCPWSRDRASGPETEITPRWERSAMTSPWRAASAWVAATSGVGPASRARSVPSLRRCSRHAASIFVPAAASMATSISRAPGAGRGGAGSGLQTTRTLSPWIGRDAPDAKRSLPPEESSS